jgi:ketosteroid isomerase-like protein
VGDTEQDRNRQVVLDQLAALARMDADAQAALMTDDVRWWAPRSAEEQAHIPRPLAGREKVARLLAGAPQMFSEMQWTVERTFADDDHVVALAHMTGRTTAGHDYDNDYVFVYRFEDGRIAEVWEHVDMAYILPRLRPPAG